MSYLDHRWLLSWPSNHHSRHHVTRPRRTFDDHTPELHGQDHGGSRGGRSRTQSFRPRRERRPPPGDPARDLEPSHAGAPLRRPLKASHRPAASGARRHTRGPRTKIEDGESRRGGAPLGDCRSASADHRRLTGRPPPTTATPTPPPAGGRDRSKGRVRVRGNPNRTPPPLCAGIWANRAGRPSAGHSQASRPTGRTAPSVPEVRLTPSTFDKSRKPP
jgi:hypothetical protein